MKFITISIGNPGGIPPTRVDEPIGAQYLSLMPSRREELAWKKRPTRFNDHQNFLYKRAINGMKFYTRQEAYSMPAKKRMNIEKTQRKAQRVLNVYKQEICNEITNSLFLHLFPKSQFALDLVQKFGKDIDPEFVNTLEFKDLGVTKRQIANKLISERVLPRNFYELRDDRSRSEPLDKL